MPLPRCWRGCSCSGPDAGCRGAACLLCFVLAAGFFTLFILADKPAFQGTAVAREGLWQRLSLLCMYLPVGALSLFYR